jgi:hypothetical protein
MLQIVKMTREEEIAMYKKLPKKQIAEMLVNCHEVLDGVSKMDYREHILCSAIWYKDLPTQAHLPINCDYGVVVCGLRHCNIIATTMALSGKRTVSGGENAAGDFIQGFLTSANRFVDREEGAKIAFAAGQINEEIKQLFSENLY